MFLKELLLVILGASVGASLRFILTKLPVLNTIDINIKTASLILLINIVGCFFIGIASSLVLSSETRLFFITGLLGSFTTYSSFILDIYKLSELQILYSLVYIALSIVLGYIFFFLGMLCVK